MGISLSDGVRFLARELGLLSIGVFIIIVAACLFAVAAGFIRVEYVVPLVIAFYGVWVIVLAGVRVKYPEKYARGAFSTFGWGVLLTGVGASWFLYLYGVNLMYALAIVLVLLGLLAVAAALRSKG